MLVFFSSFLLGRYSISIAELIDFLVRLVRMPFDSNALDGLSRTFNVIVRMRLPRITAAMFIGAALSCAGASFQGMFRNPMVSPDILGAATGSGFGAALGILLAFSYFGITLSAFLFGLAAVFLAYIVSRVSRLNATLSLVLSGMMISSLFSACTSLIKLVADTEEQLPAITYWLMGSLSSIKLEDLPFALIPITVGMIPLFLFRWRINLLTVAEDEAKTLGINITRLRFVVIVCATLMTAASVSVSGMIGWVGLVIPHFCRMLFGFDYRRIIPASAIMGAAFLMIVDNIARNVTTSEIPLGILTSFVGAPVFVYLIMSGGEARERKS